MLDPDAITAYWQSNALNNIMPNRNGVEFPEGTELFAAIRTQLHGNVLEFGCGRGRLASLFDPKQYFGVDICAAAIEVAKKVNPEHQFQLIEPFATLATVDAVLVYTVLHHIADEYLPNIAQQLRAFPTIVIAEIMQPRYRQPKMPPCLNRDFSEYVDLFSSHTLENHLDAPNQAYADTNTTVLTLCKN